MKDYYTETLLNRGADPAARASIVKKLSGFDDEAYEYKGVTALEYGKRFHNRSFANEHAVQLLASIK